MQLYGPGDGRGGTRNILSHTKSSSNELVKMLYVVG
jgi:hypothetical protein